MQAEQVRQIVKDTIKEKIGTDIVTANDALNISIDHIINYSLKYKDVIKIIDNFILDSAKYMQYSICYSLTEEQYYVRAYYELLGFKVTGEIKYTTISWR